MKKFICLILIILILSVSIVPSFAINDGIATLAVSNTYTIDQILDQGYISTLDDGLLFTGINLITYLDYLLTDDSHTCSTFHARWCDVKTSYQTVRELVESNQYKNFYLLYSVNASGYYDYTYVYSNTELISSSSKSTIAGNYVSFGFRFAYNSSGILSISRSNSYAEGASFSISVGYSGVLMSTTDVYDESGNLVFEKNVFDEEELPEDTGSDVTLGGISGAINNAFNKFGEFITNIFSSIIEAITGFFSKFTEFFDFLERIYIAYNPGIAFGKFINFFVEFLSYARSGFDVITVFVQSIPTPFSYFIYVPLLLLIWFSVFRRLL